LTRSLERCYSADNGADEVAVSIANELRRRGVKVAQSELVTLLRLLDAYVAVKGDAPSLGEIEEVYLSVLAKRGADESVVKEVFRRVCRRDGEGPISIRDAIHGDLRLLNARTGSAFKRPVRSLGRREKEAFARLALLGVIRRGRRGYYVIGSSSLDRAARSLEESYGSYDRAVSARVQSALRKKQRDLLRLLGDTVLSYVKLNVLSVGELTELYGVVRGQAAKTAVAKALAQRVLEADVQRGHASYIASILGRHRLLEPRIAEKLLTVEPRLARQLQHSLGRETVLDIAARVAKTSPSSASTIVSRTLGRREAGYAFELLARMGSTDKLAALNDNDLARLSSLSRAISSLAEYVATGNEGYLDAAAYYLEQVEPADVRERRLFEDLVRAVDAARGGDVGLTLAILVRYLDHFEAAELLTAASQRYGDHVQRVATMLAYHVLRRARDAAVRHVAKPKLREMQYGERVDIRKTVFNLVRASSQPVVWLGRRYVRRVVLVLDKSASMRRFAFYALLTASALAPLIERLVLFDERPVVYSSRVLRSAGWRRVVEAILSTRFSGYTDIVEALKAATRALTPRSLVIVTDMRQTVLRDENPWLVMEGLVSRGWRMNIIMPSGEAAAELQIREHGRVNVYSVRSVDDVIRAVTKIALKS